MAQQDKSNSVSKTSKKKKKSRDKTNLKRDKRKYAKRDKNRFMYKTTEHQQTLPEVKEAVFETFLNKDETFLKTITYRGLELKRNCKNMGYCVDDTGIDKYLTVYKGKMVYMCEDCYYCTKFKCMFKIHFMEHANTFYILEKFNKVLDCFNCYICNFKCENDAMLNEHVQEHRNKVKDYWKRKENKENNPQIESKKKKIKSSEGKKHKSLKSNKLEESMECVFVDVPMTDVLDGVIKVEVDDSNYVEYEYLESDMDEVEKSLADIKVEMRDNNSLSKKVKSKKRTNKINSSENGDKSNSNNDKTCSIVTTNSNGKLSDSKNDLIKPTDNFKYNLEFDNDFCNDDFQNGDSCDDLDSVKPSDCKDFKTSSALETVKLVNDVANNPGFVKLQTDIPLNMYVLRTETKCYKCNFTCRKGDLIQHICQEVFVCEMCNKKIITKVQYKKHCKLHSCRVCKFKCKDLNDVSMHMRECWYECDHCDFKTSRKSWFKKHKRLKPCVVGGIKEEPFEMSE